MEIFQKPCSIISHAKLNETVHDIWVYSPKIALSAKPGQFVNILVPGHFLRRPISICETLGETLRLVFEERGEGTKALGKLMPGDELDILGPLGENGFSTDKYSSAILVGGGIGTPPLKFCKNKLAKSATVLGFRTDKQVILAGEFFNVQVCTDDGSRGHHGNIGKPLEKFLKTGAYEVIMACGPKPMLKTVVNLAEKYNIPVEVSLEERMACGAGACLGCACKMKTVDRQSESNFGSIGSTAIVSYPRVCKDGPVFDGKAAVFC
ncbi:MAG: dihydroorotate dehydrogenase electron transfer subunit [Ruminococcus sp.]|jgi:dihydroorotate dehydrogenase electron transfer subunit|nr:dihydroorotate dehydrogenase electron transfer subunit [Ruminococcus sp.]